jgi:hypothetical protein
VLIEWGFVFFNWRDLSLRKLLYLPHRHIEHFIFHALLERLESNECTPYTGFTTPGYVQFCTSYIGPESVQSYTARCAIIYLAMLKPGLWSWSRSR